MSTPSNKAKKITTESKESTVNKKHTKETTVPKKYLTKIYWSDDDNAYVAEVPALPGCVSHGSSYAKAAAAIEEAMDLWLNCARKFNDPIPEPDLASEEIARLSPLLNVSKLAKLAGINKNTLASKLRRRSAFTAEEGTRILNAIAL